MTSRMETLRSTTRIWCHHACAMQRAQVTWTLTMVISNNNSLHNKYSNIRLQTKNTLTNEYPSIRYIRFSTNCKQSKLQFQESGPNIPTLLRLERLTTWLSCMRENSGKEMTLMKPGALVNPTWEKKTQRYVRKCFCELLGSIILSACLVWGL